MSSKYSIFTNIIISSPVYLKPKTKGNNPIPNQNSIYLNRKPTLRPQDIHPFKPKYIISLPGNPQAHCGKRTSRTQNAGKKEK